jgi:class 3 adenylate cyclase
MVFTSYPQLPPLAVATIDVLVVDDTLVNVLLLEKALQKQGYTVKTASSGGAALDCLKTVTPSLILLDIAMPEMDGFEVCRLLKASTDTCEIPVIFISAFNALEDIVNAFNNGGVDYIVKPFQLREVLARVNVHLSLRQLQQQLQDRNLRLQEEIQIRQLTESALKKSQAKLQQLLGDLQLEQEKSEQLLLNILPQAIAQQLKQGHTAIAEHFADVTVLFADIVEFTSYASNLPASDIVVVLNQIFSCFDQLVERYGLEKIKTIGDAYMVVGGLPNPREDHAEAVARMAIEMVSCIGRFTRADGKPFQLRIGLHTGPVEAGVIGTKKFTYDLWGDTVNLASRMETLGMAGKIQLTAATYERLRHRFRFEERGVVPVKGKDAIATYWLVGEL